MEYLTHFGGCMHNNQEIIFQLNVIK